MKQEVGAHLEDAVTVLGQGRGGVGGVHLRELLRKVADVQLVPDHRLEGSRDLLGSQLLPVDLLQREGRRRCRTQGYGWVVCPPPAY